MAAPASGGAMIDTNFLGETCGDLDCTFNPGLLVLGTCVQLITHSYNHACPLVSTHVPTARPKRSCPAPRGILVPGAQGQNVQSIQARSRPEELLVSPAHDAFGLVLAGVVARTAAQAVIHPLDTIKTRLQVTAPNKDLQLWQQGYARFQAARGLGLRLNLASLRLPSLYMGLTGAVLTTIPTAAIFFAVDGVCKRFLNLGARDNLDRHGMLAYMGSSCMASVASAVVRVPGDVLKHRVQAFMYPNVWQAARHVWRTTGLHGMYCGLGATLLRDMPEMTIQFTLYELLRKALTPAPSIHSHDKPTPPHPLLLGGLAGAAAAVATTPVDVIKSQLQCQGGACNAWSAVGSILKQRGPSGFAAGMAPRVLQTSLSSAVFFALFEALKAHMQHARAQATAVPVEAGVVVETTLPAATPGNGAGRRRQTATKVVVALEDAVEPLRL